MARPLLLRRRPAPVGTGRAGLKGDTNCAGSIADVDKCSRPIRRSKVCTTLAETSRCRPLRRLGAAALIPQARYACGEVK